MTLQEVRKLKNFLVKCIIQTLQNLEDNVDVQYTSLALERDVLVE